MRHSGESISTGKRDCPLPVNGRIHVGAEPIDPSKVWKFVGELRQPLVGYEADDRIGQCDDIMIEALQGKAVKVGKIAGHMQFGDLTCAGGHIDRASKPPVNKKDAVLEFFTFANQRLACSHLPRLRDHRANGLLFRRADGVALPQSS